MPRNKTRAVVLSRFSALGDVAMTIPAVYDLCAARPDLRVVFVTRGWMAKMFVNAPENLTVIAAELDGRHKGPRGMYRLVADLCRDYDVDTYIDLHDVLRTRFMRIFFKMRGVKVSKIDKGRAEKKELVTKGAAAFGRNLDTTDSRYRAAIRKAGYNAPERFERLFPEQLPSNTLRVGIAPFAAHPGKVYPLDRLEKVVTMLAERPDAEIFLFGAGADETAILEKWAEGHTNVVNMAKRKVGLAKELELMSTLNVMVAMDSGNMHLASIARTPRVVSIWGATHPAAGFTPFHSDPACIIGADMPCRPCSIYGSKPCRKATPDNPYPCMHSLSPEKIVALVCQ